MQNEHLKIATLFQSASQIQDLIDEADKDGETKSLIQKFSELKKTRLPFYLDEDEFDEILRWKLRGQYCRQLKLRERNTELFIISMTRSAFAVVNKAEAWETEQRLRILVKLNGVGIPVASAILTICYPDRYSVIDFRGWRQVFGQAKKYNNYSYKEYCEYLSEIKQIAFRFDLTPQEVDMAIWQYDKETNSKRN